MASTLNNCRERDGYLYMMLHTIFYLHFADGKLTKQRRSHSRAALPRRSEIMWHWLITFLRPMKLCQESPDLSYTPSQYKSGGERFARQTYSCHDTTFFRLNITATFQYNYHDAIMLYFYKFKSTCHQFSYTCILKKKYNQIFFFEVLCSTSHLFTF